MRVLIRNLVERPSPLAGAALGRFVFGKLVEVCKLPDKPEICFLDFEGIELATASFLRESILEFRDYARKTKSKLYPVVANASDDTIDEMYVLMADKGDAMISVILPSTGMITSCNVVGRLEDRQRQTLELVMQIEEAGKIADTSLLYEMRPDDGVQTLWNNRLAALVEKSLLLEFTDGRSKRFKSVTSVGGY
jgi:hypothetical protein